MLISKRYLWVVVCVVIGIQARAQVANSPFTKFGIGENYTDALANTQGMAGVGVSHPQYWYVNNQNPALLVYNMFTTFQVGIIGESQKISSGSVKKKCWWQSQLPCHSVSGKAEQVDNIHRPYALHQHELQG